MKVNVELRVWKGKSHRTRQRVRSMREKADAIADRKESGERFSLNTRKGSQWGVK